MNTPYFLPPKVVRWGDGHCLDLGTEVRHQLLDGSDTGGALSLSHSQFQFGAEVPPHVHTREDEWFCVERGHFRFQVGALTQHLSPGDFVFAPRFQPHSHRCESEEGGSLWSGTVGAGFENFFREIGESYPFLPSSSTMREVAATYGVYMDDWREIPLATMHPWFVSAGEGECLEAFAHQRRTLLPSEATEGRFCVGESETPSFSGPPMHVHEGEDEMFLIRRGCYEFQLGDARVQLGPGDVVFTPRGVPHCFRVVSHESGRALVLTTPGGFDHFFRHTSLLAEKAELTPDALATLSQQHGIRFLTLDT